MKYIAIELNGVEKRLHVEKLLFVLSKLEGKEVIFKHRLQIEEIIKKHGLFDEVFFNNLNKIW